MKKGTFHTDQTKKTQKQSAAPFSDSWSNHRPLASTKTMTGAPGGVLSPKQLAGVGRGK